MNQKFIINGGNKIEGKIKVAGAKNHVLKIIPAALLAQSSSVIENVPHIEDVYTIIDLLKKLGVDIEWSAQKELTINTKNLDKTEMDPVDTQRVRASIVLAGPLLARMHAVTLPYPGGDLIGKRPINLFVENFQQMGAKVVLTDQGYKITAKNGLKGTVIFFPKISVTGTETLIMAATLAKGKTVIKNAAQEPEILYLAETLNRMGAKVKGAGTSTIIIEGVKKLKGTKSKIIPDRIETGTFAMLGVMNNANLLIENCESDHLEALWYQFKNIGVKFELNKNWVKIIKTNTKLRSCSVQTHEYPGFATDLQPIYTLLMTQTYGNALIHDPIFEGRLFFTDNLLKMGADITMCDPHRIVVKGPSKLIAKQIESPDIRAGITLLLAGILAKGQTVIEHAQIIDRGYENIEHRLRAIGIDIIRKEI
jgi:UDP-N-acetylglucosamine 1-carboxyvinyltransferase